MTHTSVLSKQNFNQKKFYNNKASDLRLSSAKNYADQFLNNYDEDFGKRIVNRSTLKEYVETFPSKNALKIISFNLYLNERIVEKLLDLRDPLEIAYIASSIGETTYRSFINPENVSQVIEFLAPSKALGYFFTPKDIAFLMAEKLFLSEDNNIDILDPSAGYGSLLVAALVVAKEKGINVSSVCGIEIDEFTADNLKKILNRVVDLLDLNTKVDILNEDAIDHLSNGIGRLYGSTKTYNRIIMNPPYGKVKFLKNSLTNKETRTSEEFITLEDQEKKHIKNVKGIMEKLDVLSKELGFDSNIREYSKLFIALSLSNLSSSGRMSIISPSTWLGDKEAQDLRNLIINNSYLDDVFLFPEDSGLFETVNQHTSVAVFSKSRDKEGFSVTTDYNPLIKTGERNMIYYSELKKSGKNLLKIPKHHSKENEIISLLKKNPTISEIFDLKNLRGEVDLSLNKDLVSSEATGLRLIRGDHVERYILHPASKSKKDGYVKKENLYQKNSLKSKLNHHLDFRIVGRQCSYLDKKRRLDFTLVYPQHVVSNSCNYLYFESDAGLKKPSSKILTLLGLLNSGVLEWYFKLYNSNNHVANYEIGNFPVCLNGKYSHLIAKSTEFLMGAYSEGSPEGTGSSLEDFHEALVGVAYDLTPNMIGKIFSTIDKKRSARIVNFAEHIIQGILPEDYFKSTQWFNHYISTLSGLDEEIIKYVPQGGNWQDIPEHVPSQRLKQIREMSAERGVVRTTYYGRLRPEQPSYTIATYFNRPGNGTNIHPWEDRTISSREAARLQSFPDSYIFYGSEGSIRTQIGNAVPPLLAYSLGKHLGDLYGYGTCVDAFAGAGGLSCGLELAGWEVIAANDHDKHASITYRANRPTESVASDDLGKTLYSEGDISDEKVQESFLAGIKQKLGKRKLDLLVGGPPCQGFSHAGFRREDDARNDLASIYLELAKHLQPKTFVLENVEGLLTYNSGQVVRDIIRALTDLGYKVETPWVLNAEQFGAPQMRRRVLIVANKKEVVPSLKPLFRKCPGRRKAIDLSQLHLGTPVTAGEALIDLPPLKKRRFLKGAEGINKLYSRWLKGIIDTKTFLNLRSKIME